MRAISRMLVGVALAAVVIHLVPWAAVVGVVVGLGLVAHLSATRHWSSRL